MKRIALDELIEALNSIPERYFTFETVSDCLRTHPVEESSLQAHKFFDSRQPTCSSVFKNDLFELMGMCWEVAQKTPIQAYPECRIWTSIAVGRLQLRSFRIKEGKDDSCQIEEADVFEIHGPPLLISPDDPVHEWTNCLSYGERAMSLHVFSPPAKTVRSYSRNKPRVQRINHEAQDGGRIVWRLN